jgi:hypothetical protein
MEVEVLGVDLHAGEDVVERIEVAGVVKHPLVSLLVLTCRSLDCSLNWLLRFSPLFYSRWLHWGLVFGDSEWKRYLGGLRLYFLLGFLKILLFLAVFLDLPHPLILLLFPLLICHASLAEPFECFSLTHEPCLLLFLPFSHLFLDFSNLYVLLREFFLIWLRLR